MQRRQYLQPRDEHFALVTWNIYRRQYLQQRDGNFLLQAWAFSHDYEINSPLGSHWVEWKRRKLCFRNESNIEYCRHILVLDSLHWAPESRQLRKPQRIGATHIRRTDKQPGEATKTQRTVKNHKCVWPEMINQKDKVCAEPWPERFDPRNNFARECTLWPLRRTDNKSLSRLHQPQALIIWSRRCSGNSSCPQTCGFERNEMLLEGFLESFAMILGFKKGKNTLLTTKHVTCDGLVSWKTFYFVFWNGWKNMSSQLTEEKYEE